MTAIAAERKLMTNKKKFWSFLPLLMNLEGDCCDVSRAVAKSLSASEARCLHEALGEVHPEISSPVDA